MSLKNAFEELAVESKQDAQIVRQDAQILLETAIRDLLALIEAQTPTLVGGEVPVTALTDSELRAAPVPVSATIPGVATEATLAALLAKVIAAPATEAKQDAIITALGGVATQATLSALLAKVIAAPATEAKQDTQIARLNLLGTEATAAAILAKIIAAPATEAKQDAANTALGLLATEATQSTRATEATLVALLAKVIAAPATEAKQDTQITRLNLLSTESEQVLIKAIVQLIADATGLTSSPASTTARGQLGLGVRKDTATPLADLDGDYSPFQFDTNGRARVIAANANRALVTEAWTTNAANDLSSACDDFSSAIVTIRGTYATFTPIFEVSHDNINWLAIPSVRQDTRASVAAAGAATGANASAIYSVSCNGFYFFRVRTAAGPSTGTANITISLSAMPAVTDLLAVVSGSVSGSGTFTTSLASTVANLGLANNSRVDDTTTNLGAGATFTGTARDNGATGSAQAFSSFVMTVFSDVASAANGVIIEESINGSTNWRPVKTATLVANVPKTIGMPTSYRFYRPRYVNGAAPTTVLEIVTQQHRFPMIPFEQ